MKRLIDEGVSELPKELYLKFVSRDGDPEYTMEIDVQIQGDIGVELVNLSNPGSQFARAIDLTRSFNEKCTKMSAQQAVLVAIATAPIDNYLDKCGTVSDFNEFNGNIDYINWYRTNLLERTTDWTIRSRSRYVFS